MVPHCGSWGCRVGLIEPGEEGGGSGLIIPPKAMEVAEAAVKWTWHHQSELYGVAVEGGLWGYLTAKFGQIPAVQTCKKAGTDSYLENMEMMEASRVGWEYGATVLFLNCVGEGAVNP